MIVSYWCDCFMWDTKTVSRDNFLSFLQVPKPVDYSSQPWYVHGVCRSKCFQCLLKIRSEPVHGWKEMRWSTLITKYKLTEYTQSTRKCEQNLAAQILTSLSEIGSSGHRQIRNKSDGVFTVRTICILDREAEVRLQYVPEVQWMLPCHIWSG